jgi:hypothetical protein
MIIMNIMQPLYTLTRSCWQDEAGAHHMHEVSDKRSGWSPLKTEWHPASCGSQRPVSGPSNMVAT